MGKASILTIYFTMKANMLIYALGKVPIIKNLMTNNLRKLSGVKYIAGLISLVLDVLMKTVAAGASTYILSYFIPLKIFEFANVVLTQIDLIVIFIIISCLLPAMIQSTLFKLGRDDHMYLNYFQMEPSRYYRYKIIKQVIVKVLFLTPTLYIIFDNWSVVILLVSLKLMLMTFGNVVYTKCYDHNIKLPSVDFRAGGSLIVTVVTYVVCLLVQLKPFTYNDTVLYIVSLVAILIGVWGIKFLLGYPDYLSVARNFATSETASLRVSVSTNAEAGAIALKVTDVEENKNFFQENSQLTGFDYINKSFIHRHKKFINKFYRNKVIMLIGAGILAGLAMNYKDFTVDVSWLLERTGAFIVILGFMSYSKGFCQLHFYHCDVYLLENNFYKDSSIVYKGFLFRLKFLLKRTGLTSIAFGIGITLLMILSGSSFEFKGIGALYMTCVSLLFFYEAYNMFTYYLLQPYTKTATLKKPIHKLVASGEAIISIVLLVVKADLSLYAMPVFLATLLILVTGIVAVKRFGSKTFVLD